MPDTALGFAADPVIEDTADSASNIGVDEIRVSISPDNASNTPYRAVVNNNKFHCNVHNQGIVGIVCFFISFASHYPFDVTVIHGILGGMAYPTGRYAYKLYHVAAIDSVSKDGVKETASKFYSKQV